VRYGTSPTEAVKGQVRGVKGRLATAAVLAIVLAGCGESGNMGASLSTFAAAFSKDRVQFRKLGVELAQDLGGAHSRTDAQLATEMAQLSKRAHVQAVKLKQLDPPAAYKNSVNKLTIGLSAVALDLRRISRASIRNDAQTASEATRALIAHSARVKAADVAISKALQHTDKN
jgi:hypothetical protein